MFVFVPANKPVICCVYFLGNGHAYVILEFYSDLLLSSADAPRIGGEKKRNNPEGIGVLSVRRICPTGLLDRPP